MNEFLKKSSEPSTLGSDKDKRKIDRTMNYTDITTANDYWFNPF